MIIFFIFIIFIFYFHVKRQNTFYFIKHIIEKYDLYHGGIINFNYYKVMVYNHNDIRIDVKFYKKDIIIAEYYISIDDDTMYGEIRDNYHFNKLKEFC